jgi:oligopeptide transport system permease protein
MSKTPRGEPVTSAGGRRAGGARSAQGESTLFDDRDPRAPIEKRIPGHTAEHTEHSASAPGRDSELPGSTEDLRQASLWSDAWRQLRRNPMFVVASLLLIILTVMAVRPQLFTNADPRSCDLGRSRGTPSADAFFGYDTFGCDYFANVIYGARVSMTIGLLVVGGALIIGVTLGALAGYYGGWFDSIIARITDIAYGLPLILGAILILQVLGQHGLFQVSIALMALAWMTILRLFRSSVISIKETDYVAAARAMGAKNGRIIRQHILPNALAPVLVYATIAVGGIIAAEAALSFLGIGLRLPAISWGLQINSAQNYLRTAPHLLLFPSIFLSVTVLSFIMLGDALRDALDPKLR